MESQSTPVPLPSALEGGLIGAKYPTICSLLSCGSSCELMPQNLPRPKRNLHTRLTKSPALVQDFLPTVLTATQPGGRGEVGDHCISGFTIEFYVEYRESCQCGDITSVFPPAVMLCHWHDIISPNSPPLHSMQLAELGWALQ